MLDILAHSIYRASGFEVPAAITIVSPASPTPRPSIFATAFAAACRGTGRLFHGAA